MAGGDFFKKAIFRTRKDTAPPEDDQLYGLAGNAEHLVFVNAAGEVTAGAPETIVPIILELPRYAKIFVTPERGRDISIWLIESGLYPAMTSAGMMLEPTYSGTNVVALRMFKTVDNEQPFATIISTRNYDPSTKYHGEPYSDAQFAVRRGKHTAWAVWEQFGVNIGLTPASTSYAAFRRAMDSARVYFRPHRVAVKEVRNAYFGGAVWSSKRTVKDVRMYDMRGAYAWAMRQGVPIGRPVYTVHEEYDVPGFYLVRALLNPDYPSPFMVRDRPFVGPGVQSSNTHTETWVSSLELELCREWGGFYEVIEGWIFPEGIDFLFDTFINKIDQAERNTTGIARSTAKLMRNSLYGRFGRKPYVESVRISATQPGDNYGPHYNARGPVGQMWSARLEDEQPSGEMPQWAAWITSQVRCRLLRAWVALLDAGHHVFYLDTDSIITDGVMQTGQEFGDWQLKHVFTVFQVFASKIYAGYDARLGETVLAHAGIPRSETNRIIEKFESTHLLTKKPP